MTSRKSGNALRTFDCLKLYFIKQIRVCHVELTGTLIICRQSTTFHNNFLILFIQFPSTTYTRAYRRIWYLNSGDSGIKFPFFKIPTLGKLLQTIKSRKIWLWLPRFNTLSQIKFFGDYETQKKLKEEKNIALKIYSPERKCMMKWTA